MAMQQGTLPWIPKTAHAVLSDDRKYRYVLYRSLDGLAWDQELRPDGKKRLTVCFVMLNPSQADENKNDPTIEKLIKYASAWGFQWLSVVNVYALIETDSKELRRFLAKYDTECVGDHNLAFLENELGNADKVVCGWGNEGVKRNDVIHALLGPNGLNKRAWCFKKSLTGTPVHPLYQRDAAELVPYELDP
jgi:hypothetical protein